MIPLAERIRPKKISEFIAADTLINVVNQIFKAPYLSSIILWGPTGSGKTTLARLLCDNFSDRYDFVELSAVSSGVKDIKELSESASLKRKILFLDEIHRFNKSQQDSLLPHVENGKIVLIGATTENPSFSIITPLLSRCRLITIPIHNEESLKKIAQRASSILGFELTQNLEKQLIESSQSDARRLLNTIEYLYQNNCLTEEGLTQYHTGFIPYDKSGDMHYDFASALIKSLRGSDPDASLFYAFKMLEAGDDPRFIFRRLIIFASEDIGNADPNALRLAVTAAEAFERIGMPEGRIPLAHVITYLASCPKSNRSYIAMHKILEAIQQNPTATPPLHLQNTPTKLMKKQGKDAEYQYPHDDPKGYVAGVDYLPDRIKGVVFYEPSTHGAEAKISERLKLIRSTRNK